MVQDKIQLYPNPVTDQLIVSINKPAIEVWNMNGQLLRVQPLRNAVETISLKGLAAGIYFVKVQNGATLISKKVVKQ